MKIAVAGAGYVGLSLAVLLARDNDVELVDVVPEKVEAVNAGRSPIADPDIEGRLAEGGLRLRATLDGAAAYAGAEFVVVAAPTNYDPDLNHFDTSLVEQVVELALAANPSATVVVKSTVPVGYTRSLCERHPEGRFLFSPEFLREGRALYDNLHPSRIVVGVPSESPRAAEAEAVKLFANTYLALRVAYFNELDTYADVRGLDAGAIIDAVCLDPRIGAHYNNPSFGYGGYCLPKDTK